MKKTQIWLTAQEVDLLTSILAHTQVAMKDCSDNNNLTEKIGRVCIRYCSRRVDDILAKLGVPIK